MRRLPPPPLLLLLASLVGGAHGLAHTIRDRTPSLQTSLQSFGGQLESEDRAPGGVFDLPSTSCRRSSSVNLLQHQAAAHHREHVRGTAIQTRNRSLSKDELAAAKNWSAAAATQLNWSAAAAWRQPRAEARWEGTRRPLSLAEVIETPSAGGAILHAAGVAGAGGEISPPLMIAAVGMLMCLTVYLVFWCAHNFVNESVKTGLETFDRRVLGVDLNFDLMDINIFSGSIEITDLVVGNPAGAQWSSPYLLRAGKVFVDVDLWEMARSGGRTVDVQKAIIRDVDVILEALAFDTNVHMLLSQMEKREEKNKRKPGAQQPSSPGASPSASSPGASAGCYAADRMQGQGQQQQQGGGFSLFGACLRQPMQSGAESTSSGSFAGSLLQGSGGARELEAGSSNRFQLHEVVIEEVGLQLMSGELAGAPLHLYVGNISYDDFEKEVGQTALDDILHILLKTVLKTVAYNLAGKRVGDRVF